MLLETEIKGDQTSTCIPGSTEYGDALGGRDGVNCEMHLDAVIEAVGKYPCKFMIGQDRMSNWRQLIRG
jgi:hypothetical protein